jgi:hypothetical protein
LKVADAALTASDWLGIEREMEIFEDRHHLNSMQFFLARS